MKTSFGILLALAATAALAACKGNLFGNGYGYGYGYGYGGYTPPPVTNPNCGKPPYDLTVLYPRPNAKQIPAAVRGVWVATSQALPSGNRYDFFAEVSNGSQQDTSRFVKSTGTIPTPHATVPPGYVVYTTHFVTQIGSGHGVRLFWNNQTTNCSPNIIVSAFSTK
ncbi:MAG TPA: hypothetical protein VMF61_12475 [Candidatus Acidoferrales bacterium]|nr:hypothetical protein [Candidatus Acidoferrales bacterium]